MKLAAKKLKQITELSDPTPMDVVLPPRDAEGAKQDYGADEVSCGVKVVAQEAKSARPSGRIGEMSSPPAGVPLSPVVPSVVVVRARAIWEEVVKGAGRSATALFERLDALTDPRRVEDANMLAAWREKYMNKITERTKRTWWLKRLWKKAG